MNECPFCNAQALESRTLETTAHAFAFLTNIPIVPGHALIAPVRHVQYYEELNEAEREEIEQLRMRVKQAQKIAFGAEGYNYAWNEERIGGQSVPHFHLHVLPRKAGDTGIYGYEPREFLYRPQKERPVSEEEELAQVATELKQSL